MAAGGLPFVLVVLLGIGVSLVLYALVRTEREQRQVRPRDEAERLARRDSTDDE